MVEAIENEKFCVNCGSKIDKNAAMCPNCGVMQSKADTRKNTKFCSECGSEINVKAEICPKCGVRQSMRQEKIPKRTKFCSKCGADINEKAELCIKCGTMQPRISCMNSSALPVVDKNPVVAALLTFLIFITGYWYIGRLKRGAVVMALSLVITAMTGGVGYLVMMPLAMYDTYKLASNEPAPYDVLHQWNMG
jgi:RNA polymerase subunit RPABC4/transcription elongation factor Spt4